MSPSVRFTSCPPSLVFHFGHQFNTTRRSSTWLRSVFFPSLVIIACAPPPHWVAPNTPNFNFTPINTTFNKPHIVTVARASIGLYCHQQNSSSSFSGLSPVIGFIHLVGHQSGVTGQHHQYQVNGWFGFVMLSVIGYSFSHGQVSSNHLHHQNRRPGLQSSRPPTVLEFA